MRLIDVDEIWKELGIVYEHRNGEVSWNDAIWEIKKAPTIEERKTGKWINAYPDIEPNPMLMYGICSVCGFEQSISDKLKYCPNCGARMVQEGEDNDC